MNTTWANSHAVVGPQAMARQNTWDAAFFCGPLRQLVVVEAKMAPAERAQVFEDLVHQAVDLVDGLADQGVPVFRPTNVGILECHPDRTQARAPLVSGRACVEPGDVVVTKIAPIRAAWATPRLHRHPIDSSCCLVRGLGPRHAFWLALAINQPAYGNYLLRRSGGTILPRVRSSVILKLPLPKPPAEVDRLAGQAAACLDRRLANLEELFRLQDSADGAVRDTVWDETAADRRRVTGGSWSRFFPAVDVDESLVPAHVVLTGLQRRLRDEAGWVGLRKLLGRHHLEQARLGGEPLHAPYLRLSDVGNDLAVPQQVPASEIRYVRRVYAEPLRPDEVLLSGLVTSPRVAFASQLAGRELLVSDHWQRLQFRETPGAWALVLDTAAVREQLALMAVGNFQQFANAATIARLVLPDVPLATRLGWDAALRRQQQRRAEHEREWTELMVQANGLLIRSLADLGVSIDPDDAVVAAEVRA
ncbi:MAG TPA: hypothetical protein VMV69_19230 [Pirellulales bacterium]|nr:hypothetical protein [Pirellulales bacterium]